MLVRWLYEICFRESVRTGSRHDAVRAALFLALMEMRKLLSKQSAFLDDRTLRDLEYYNEMFHNCLNSASYAALMTPGLSYVIYHGTPECGS